MVKSSRSFEANASVSRRTRQRCETLLISKFKEIQPTAYITATRLAACHIQFVRGADGLSNRDLNVRRLCRKVELPLMRSIKGSLP